MSRYGVSIEIGNHYLSRKKIVANNLSYEEAKKIANEYKEKGFKTYVFLEKGVALQLQEYNFK